MTLWALWPLFLEPQSQLSTQVVEAGASERGHRFSCPARQRKFSEESDILVLARTPGDSSVGRDPFPDFHLPGNSDWRGTERVPLLGLKWLVSPPSLESSVSPPLSRWGSQIALTFSIFRPNFGGTW